MKLTPQLSAQVGEVTRGASHPRDFSGTKTIPDDAFEMFPVLLSILFFTLDYHKGIDGSVL